MGGVISKQQVADLPLNGRSVIELIALVPGVELRGNSNQMSIGGKGEFTNEGGLHFLLDGGDASRVDFDDLNNTYGSSAGRISRESVDAVEEFRVYTDAYSAEYGQTQGGVINLITKSGTNDMHGSLFTKLIVKELGKDFAPPNSNRLVNEFRGYFITQRAWHSSTENPARITIAENGPLRAAVVIDEQVGGVPYQSRVSLVQEQRRIDFHVRFMFEQDTWIGDPWEIKPADRRKEQRRSQNDGRWKLQAFFPVSFQQGALYKNAAFDVCRSRNQNTFFQRWDEIKHNIIVNWVDIADPDEKYGLALLSDHTTAYTNGQQYPLALVLAWAWEGGFWWGKHPLRGAQEMSYAIVPHQGTWDTAGISEECSRYSERLVSQLVEGTPAGRDASYSMLQVDSRAIHVSTLLVENGALLVRLFNADSNESAHVVVFPNRPKQIEVVELDGRASQTLVIHTSGEYRHQVRIDIPKFGLRVLKCTWE